MSSTRQFIANIMKTAGASGSQFLITLVATPIMTRLYAPEAYAMFGIINTTATVLVGVGLLTLPSAYAGEKSADIRAQMVITMLLLLFGLAILSALGAACMAIADALHMGIHISWAALALLPVLVLTYGVRQILVNMSIQRGNFNRLSLGHVIEPLCSRGTSIALGAGLGGNPVFILLSVMLGHISTIFISRTMMIATPLRQWRKLIGQTSVVRATLMRFSDFTVFGTASQQAQQVILLAMQIGIAAFFSAHIAGQYILAVSILTLPVSLIALATAPVAYHHFIVTEKNAPHLLWRHGIVTMGLYLLAGIVILLPVFFFGEVIFRVAFGEIWSHAGTIASTLSIAYIGFFAVTGVQSLFMVTRCLKSQFLTEIVTAAIALTAAILVFKVMDFDRAIFYLSLIWLFRSVVLLWMTMLVAYQHSHRLALVHDD